MEMADEKKTIFSEKLREELGNAVFESRQGYVYDCGRDIAIHGYHVESLWEMSDEDLLIEYEQDVICLEDMEEGEVDDLHQRAKAEIAVQEMLES
jgi:hypothetical protein